MKHSIICFIMLFISGLTTAQQTFLREKRDYIWTFGFGLVTNPQGKNFWLDFNDIPVSIHEKPRFISIDIANAGMCDLNGDLLFTCNGFRVMNRFHQLIGNGDGLNPGIMTNDWLPYGQPLDQGAIALSMPGSDNLYYLFHGRRESQPMDMYGVTSSVFPFFYSLINISNTQPGGAIVEKNIILKEGPVSLGKLTSVRHANGRDWWVIVFGYFSNSYYRFLLHPQGVTELEADTVGNVIPSGVGQAVFSPDGTKYAKLNLHLGPYLDIYDFDRCTGMLSNPVHLTYDPHPLHGGVAFSPNSRYLYVSSDRYVYQYDTEAEDIAASRIILVSLEANPSETDFAMAQLGPDQKVYVSGYNLKELHVIHNPNASGLACNFEKTAFSFSHFLGRSIPNHPYYGLGPLDGSPCDTLGIDHHPQAVFRHAEQELEATFWDYSLFFPTQWQWDFGDGSAGSTEQNPMHEYAEPGVYEVCLTVSNANASDTYCEWVEVMVTATGEVTPNEMAVKVYPNPAKDYVVIEPQQRLPRGAFWSLRDALGRELRRASLPEGQPQLVLNLEGLPGGVYFCSIEAGGMARWQGKIIKQ
jgi:hypothetical protein